MCARWSGRCLGPCVIAGRDFSLFKPACPKMAALATSFQSFDSVKALLTTDSILAAPNFTPPFALAVDASD